MILQRKNWLVAILFSSILSGVASAGSIVGFTPSASLGFGTFSGTSGSVAAFPGTPNTFLVPAAPTYVSGDNPGTPAASPNYVNLTANVTALHGAVEGNINILDQGGANFGFGPVNGPHEYFFSITVNNNSLFPIGPTVVELFLAAASPIPIGAGGVNFDAPIDRLPAPTSTYNTGVDTSNFALSFQTTLLNFGGLAGGGGEIPQGGSGVLTFSFDIPDMADFSTANVGIRLTANPEPTSMALASAGLGIVGLIGGWRRARRKNAS